MEKDRKLQTEDRVVRICGLKNSGKTTLMTALIRRFTEMGYRVAAIKHDGHEFSCDVPGTDSFHFAEAGSCGTAVFSATQCFVRKNFPVTGAQETVQKLIQCFPEAEIILVEGMKDSPGNKIEVIRKTGSSGPVSNPRGRFLLVSDKPLPACGEEVLPFSAVGEIAERILNTVFSEAYKRK